MGPSRVLGRAPRPSRTPSTAPGFGTTVLITPTLAASRLIDGKKKNKDNKPEPVLLPPPARTRREQHHEQHPDMRSLTGQHLLDSAVVEAAVSSGLAVRADGRSVQLSRSRPESRAGTATMRTNTQEVLAPSRIHRRREAGGLPARSQRRRE